MKPNHLQMKAKKMRKETGAEMMKEIKINIAAEETKARIEAAEETEARIETAEAMKEALEETKAMKEGMRGTDQMKGTEM